MPVNRDVWKLGLVKQTWSQECNLKEWTVKGISVDVIYFHKAFDLVLHDSLAKILVLHDISKVFVKWIKNWLAKRPQRHSLWEVSLNERESRGFLQELISSSNAIQGLSMIWK